MSLPHSNAQPTLKVRTKIRAQQVYLGAKSGIAQSNGRRRTKLPASPAVTLSVGVGDRETLPRSRL